MSTTPHPEGESRSHRGVDARADAQSGPRVRAAAALARDGRGDGTLRAVRAYTRLVVANGRAVPRLTKGLALGDLVQEGNVGLMQAARPFEPASDVCFSTYASWWIFARRCRITYRATGRSSVPAPPRRKSCCSSVFAVGARGSSRNQARGSACQPAQDRGRAQSRRRRGRDDRPPTQFCRPVLEAPIKTGGTDWQDVLPGGQPSPEDAHDGARRSRWLAEAILELSPRASSANSAWATEGRHSKSSAARWAYPRKECARSRTARAPQALPRGLAPRRATARSQQRECVFRQPRVAAALFYSHAYSLDIGSIFKLSQLIFIYVAAILSRCYRLIARRVAMLVGQEGQLWKAFAPTGRSSLPSTRIMSRCIARAAFRKSSARLTISITGPSAPLPPGRASLESARESRDHEIKKWPRGRLRGLRDSEGVQG
jgi:RNA polymerase sigma factor (sigma-70 family)